MEVIPSFRLVIWDEIFCLKDSFGEWVPKIIIEVEYLVSLDDVLFIENYLLKGLRLEV